MLVVSQVAVSLVLLIARRAWCCAAMPRRSRPTAGSTPPTSPSIASICRPAGYDEPAGRSSINRLLDALAAEPAFAGASLAMNVPMSLVDGASRATNIESYAPRPDEDMMFLYNIVSPDYFQTLRIPLLAGREFTRTDDASAQPAVIVNETLARRVWQTPENAVGKRLRSGSGEWRIGDRRGERRQVFAPVGTAAAVRLLPAAAELYPRLHDSRARGQATSRTRCAAFATHVQAIDPAIPIVRSTTLAEQTRVALSVYELAAGALTMFGVMTIVLAAIGIYGLVAYTVQQSTQEIGIRMAVGAQRTGRGLEFPAAAAPGSRGMAPRSDWSLATRGERRHRLAALRRRRARSGRVRRRDGAS